MGKFSSKYIYFRAIGNQKIQLTEDFTYYPDKKYGYKPVTAKKDFISDLMSVTWYVRPIVTKFSDMLWAVIPHDIIFELQDRPLKEATHIFKLALEDASKLEHLKIPWIKRTLAYSGVWIGSWVPWKKQAKILKKMLKKKEAK